LTASLSAPNAPRYDRAGMSEAQAERFDAKWSVLSQAPDSWWSGFGFSAVLLQNRQTGEKVLAIRGTEESQWGADVITDIVDIAVVGSVNNMTQYSALENYYNQLKAEGKLGASEQFTVTGHSLGGFLTQAFTARHADVVAAAYTFNAPGFGGATVQLLEIIGITDASAPNSRIVNVRAADGVSATAGLGQVLGSVQQVRVEAGSANDKVFLCAA
jgi:pimeloyl-ACP methyl ester carboxylesterase